MIPTSSLMSQIMYNPADPMFGLTQLIIQGGTAVDQSSKARTLAFSGATQNSSAWTFNGQNTIKLTADSGNSSIAWDPTGAQLSNRNFTYEVAVNSDGGVHLYVDALGNSSAGLNMRTATTGTTGWTGGLNGNPQGMGGTLTTYPLGPGYFCLERVGRFMYTSWNGVITSTVDLGSTGFTFNNASINPRIGEDIATSSPFVGGFCHIGQLRLTMDGTRYGGANFTVPTGLFPLG
jgi:hypothetical protein